jgi:hypothetical protein
LTNWLHAYARGLNDFQFEAQVLGSDEFYADRQHSNARFVTTLYWDVLERPPQTAELGFWLSFMASH